eukprot:9593704-Alexandrium_andersonii.AAC.1
MFGDLLVPGPLHWADSGLGARAVNRLGPPSWSPKGTAQTAAGGPRRARYRRVGSPRWRWGDGVRRQALVA